MGIRCADHVTPLYPQKLALTSPTGGGRSVGIFARGLRPQSFFFVMDILFERAEVTEAVFAIVFYMILLFLFWA